MKVLVIGSCTGSKDDCDCPSNIKLTEADFNDAVRLRAREGELARFLKPAAQMYTGRQHTQMMDGIRLLRTAFGRGSCDVAIVSAGYGLVAEDRLIAPYDLTFQGMPKPLIKARGAKLGIPEAIRKLVNDYSVVFLLLGDDYLRSAQPPLVPGDEQKFIAFGSPQLRTVPGADIVVVPAAQRQATEFGDGVVTLKGRMFHLFAAGLRARPSAWNEFLRDKTPETMLTLMRIGRQHV